VILLVLIVGLIIAFSFVFLIERRKKARNRRRMKNNKGKFEYIRRVLNDDIS